MGHSRQVIPHTLNNEQPEILVGHFAATELELDFHLVALVEKVLRMPNLGEVVVGVDIHPELDFLHLADRMFLFLLLLRQVVAEFPEIHDTANGRLGIRSDLDEIQSESTGSPDRFVQAHDAELFIGCGKNHAHLAGADSFIDTDVLDINRSSSVRGVSSEHESNSSCRSVGEKRAHAAR